MSEAVNPYAAPTAVVADRYGDDETYQPVKLFSAEGRIGRLRFLAYLFYSYLILAVAIGVIGGVLGSLGFSGLGSLLTLLMLIPYFVFYVFTGIRRSHDMNWSGWTVLLALIPLVGLVWVFNPGTAGSNRFGAPPTPNPLSVKIGGLLFPIVFVLIGILAAIALPAYQDYTQRAKAAQVVKP
ncbi:DUF805 domain-containing protein [Variovorax humicola]|uniref:DUF805 domain-containing protein n=1 Tax=Variovorax humicola TaxID=1769758 RepID=A0ABU8W4Q5_9BURK